MNNNWLIVVNKFFEDWESKDYAEGALVCGSFVT